MQCQCGTDTSTMVDIHGLMEIEVRPGDWGNQCLLVGYQNLS